MNAHQTLLPGMLLEASQELLRMKPLSPYKSCPEIARGERAKAVFILVEGEKDE